VFSRVRRRRRRGGRGGRRAREEGERVGPGLRVPGTVTLLADVWGRREVSWVYGFARELSLDPRVLVGKLRATNLCAMVPVEHTFESLTSKHSSYCLRSRFPNTFHPFVWSIPKDFLQNLSDSFFLRTFNTCSYVKHRDIYNTQREDLIRNTMKNRHLEKRYNTMKNRNSDA
jgi:hypothetical protein